MIPALIKRKHDGSIARTDDQTLPVMTPSVDVGETVDEYVIVADLPGLQPDDIDVMHEQNRLEIRGRASSRAERSSYVRREFRAGEYARHFDLDGCSIDGDRIAASYKDGVLTVRLPKSADVRPRRIQVD